MHLRKCSGVIAALSVAVFTVVSAGVSFAAKPTVGSMCKQCHQPQVDLVRGTLVGVSEKFRTIQVAVGSLVWVIKYGDDTLIKGADKIAVIPKDKEVGVTFKGDEKNPYAVSVSLKPPAKIAPEKLSKVEEVQKLVAMGPEKGNYLLVDSRPKPRFLEGHIPTAVSLSNDKFDQMKDSVLPTDRGRLVIFYCGGVT